MADETSNPETAEKKLSKGEAVIRAKAKEIEETGK